MAASALETHLNALESKVDGLLAVFQSCDPPDQEEAANEHETGKRHDELNPEERSL